MKNFSEIFKRFTAALLCFIMLLSVPSAFAEELPAEAQEEGAEQSIIDSDELQTMVEDYIKSHGLNGDFISIGYCYTETGDTWYYHPDEWYYSASIYKVPLFMIMAEREYNGEYTQDTEINGVKLSDLEDMVLINSNNDYAHHVLNFLGNTPVETMEGNRVGREMYRNYSPLPEDYYIDNFYDYSYFTARFMTDVMKTLYFDNERFPGIIERLKKAQPNEYFNRKMGGRYEVAQKYGALNDVNGVPFNHTAGIIYTPHPYILTVMTKNHGLGDEIIADFAVLFEEYTLKLDSQLEKFEQEKAEAERLKAEEEKRQADEAERLEQERIAEEKRRAAEEAERLEQERIAAEKEARKDKIIKISVAAVSVTAVVLAAVLIISGIKKKAEKARSIEHTREQERKARPLRSEKVQTEASRPAGERNENGRKASRGNHYTPKH